MRRSALTFLLLLLLGVSAIAQSQSSNKQQSTPPASENPDDILNSPMTPPRSDAPTKKSTEEEFPFPESEEKGNYSSSKDTQGDINPPSDDKSHPGGDVKIAPSDGVTEMKPWDPHKADKDIEVGTFYYKRGNYKGAEARFRDALYWQDNHAEAMFRLAQTLDKEGRGAEARPYYQSYLKILPQGDFAAESRKALARLNAESGKQKTQVKKSPTSPSL